MDWLIKGLLTNAIWAAIAVLGGLLVGYLKLRGSHLLWPAIWALLGAALLSVSLAAFTYRSPGAEASQITQENAEELVRKWADGFGLGVQRVDLEDATFTLRIMLKNERSVFVRQLKSLPRYLVVQSTVTLSDEHRQMYSSLTEQQRQSALEQVLLELSRAGRDSNLEIDLSKKLFLIHDVQRLPITSRLDEHELMAAIDRASIAWMLMRNAIVLNLKAAGPTALNAR